MTKRLAVAVLAAMAVPASADRVAAPPPTQTPPIPERLRRRRPPPPSPVDTILKESQAIAGSWACKGVVMLGTGASTPMTATLVLTADLDSTWIHGKLAQTGDGAFKVELYRTFDPVAQQWTELSMSNDGAHQTATSTGEANGVWTWVGEDISTAGTVQRRDYEQRGGGGVKVWGERSLGGEWQKSYELSCNR
jgi:hypothetical protein